VREPNSRICGGHTKDLNYLPVPDFKRKTFATRQRALSVGKKFFPFTLRNNYHRCHSSAKRLLAERPPVF
jgi:hypothetical protein